MSNDLVVSMPDIDCSDPVAVGQAMARMCFVLSSQEFAQILGCRLDEIKKDLCEGDALAGDAKIICDVMRAAAEAEWAKISLSTSHHGGRA